MGGSRCAARARHRDEYVVQLHLHFRNRCGAEQARPGRDERACAADGERRAQHRADIRELAFLALARDGI